MSKQEQKQRVRELLLSQRWAALATTGDEQQPEASMVAFAMDDGLNEAYLHLSTLAAHTRNLERQPLASLVISECDSGKGDPQQLARLSLYGRVTILEAGSEAYAAAKRRYLSRLPDAAPLFDFADFRLFCFSVEKLRFVGGFAQAHRYTPAELR